MDDWEKEYNEYVQKYARDYCNGNVDEAETHAMVKETRKYYRERSEGK